MQNVKCEISNAEGGDSPAPFSSTIEATVKCDLSERLLDFADRICTLVEALPDTRVGRHIAGQLLGSGTSPMANYEEACAAESNSGFVHKLRVCLKEVRESRGWLRLIARRKHFSGNRLDDLIDEAHQLARILGKSIATAKRSEKPKMRRLK